MRLARTSTAIGMLLTLTCTPAYAGQKGSPKNHAPRATAQHGPAPKTAAPKPAKAPSAKLSATRVARADAKSSRVAAKSAKVHVKAARVDAKSAKVNAKSAKVNAKAARVEAKSAKIDAKAARVEAKSAKKATTATTTASTTRATTATIDFTAGSVGNKLSKNTALRSKLESRLAALGYEGSAYQAAYGFKNLGQFVAATNVSRNLGIPFEQLKIQMTGLSVAPNGTVLKANIGPDGRVVMVDPALAGDPASTRTLGQSIQRLKSNVDAIGAAQTGSMQADAEIQRTSTVAVR